MIPYGRQHVNQDDIDAVLQVLQSEFLTQGPKVPQFERALANYVSNSEAVVVNNATSALHLTCLSLGLRPGDWLWTSPITFVASANCALYCGANIDFVDIDPATYNLCPNKLEAKLKVAAVEGRLPKVLVPVHMAGQSCDMESLSFLSKRYNIKIIEDASHAIGGRHRNKPIGNSDFSDATVFSFHPVKIITTGEGGAVITKSDELANNIRLLRSHGITREPSRMVGKTEGPWYYQQVDLGFNYRLTDIQASLGLSQLARIDLYVDQRQNFARRYTKLLQDLPVDTPWQHPDNYSSYHLYIIKLRLNEIKSSRREIFDTLLASGIGVNIHYIPVHLQPYYVRLGFNKGDFPVAEAYYEAALTLPLYPTMTFEQQDFIVEALKEIL